jgi:hypothetical protein
MSKMSPLFALAVFSDREEIKKVSLRTESSATFYKATAAVFRCIPVFIIKVYKSPINPAPEKFG